MRPEMLACIEKFVKEGLTVVGPAPKRSPSLASWPEADSKVEQIAAQMWSADGKVNRYGKGTVWPGDADMRDVLAALDIMPDLSVPAGQQMPLFIHPRSATPRFTSWLTPRRNES